ncbi:MAG: ABC transporter permease subunit [Planctomycetota bacterium]|nr:ABC transporter permease subunit [Planctomycetota bacterium]
MFARVGRLYVAELMKALRQRLPLAAVIVVLLVAFLSLYGSMRSIEGQIKQELGESYEREPGGIPGPNADDPPRTARTKKSFFPSLPASKGYECLAHTWKYSLELGAFFLLVFGSLLVSSEVAQGTVRTTLQRPIRRIDFMLAKVLILLTATLFLAVVIASAGLLLVHVLVGFGNVTDLQWETEFRAHSNTGPEAASPEATEPTSARRPAWLFFYGSEMKAFALKSFLLLLLPFACAGFLGFFISSIVSSPGTAVGIAVIVHYVLSALLEIFKGWQRYYFESYFEQALSWLLNVSQGIKTHLTPFKAVSWTSSEVYVPLAYIVAFVVVSVLVFQRRDVVT